LTVRIGGIATQLSRRKALVSLSAVAVVAVGGLVYATTHDATTHDATTHDGTSPHAPAAAPAVATRTATSSTTPTPTPTRPPAPRHDHVPASVPTSFRITGRAFTVNAAVCQMDNVRPLDPPGDQLHTVCWVKQGFGVAPSSPSGGTSYILGHAWAQQQLVFNPLSEYAMKHLAAHPRMRSGVATTPVLGLSGYRITLRTGTGVLSYVVRHAFTVAKERAGYVASIMADKTPDRVVLITCGVKDGVDVDVNVIVYAYLTSATRLTT
jgi:hypothetical protein